MTGWTLPQEAEIGGRQYRLRGDYRDILEIISVLQDEQEPAHTRLTVALALFYQEFDRLPPADYQAAAGYLMWFLAGGEEPGHQARPAARTMDWEQDRALVVADINKVAGCEIRALEFCHWWTFLAWFHSIGEGQLSTVVSIREKKRRGKKLTDWEREFYLANRDKVELRRRYTDQELAQRQRLEALLE